MILDSHVTKTFENFLFVIWLSVEHLLDKFSSFLYFHTLWAIRDICNMFHPLLLVEPVSDIRRVNQNLVFSMLDIPSSFLLNPHIANGS